jgi:DNA-binding NarL/FixJ family response regulator/class 3 adenylate cyclase
MNDFPAGTITFLFSDIEDSTALLTQLSEDYTALLAEQREILRHAFAQHEGQEVSVQGDSFFVAFPRATEAVAAAIDGQRHMAAHEWPGGVAVRIRIGLHTGEPWLADAGYVGMDVHRAARIGYAGHGGQVLLSETTAVLVRDELPGDVNLQDLGTYHLKGMRRPERIYQLVVDGLPAQFPPLRLLAARRNRETTPTLADSLAGEGIDSDTVDRAPASEPSLPPKTSSLDCAVQEEEREAHKVTGKIVNVLIVDDHTLFRTGIRKMLEAEPDMCVVGEAATGREALAQARALTPDVILMDVKMPDPSAAAGEALDGVEATRRLCQEMPQVGVIFCTMFEDDEFVFGGLQAGGRGYILKDSDPDTMLRAIRAVAHGESLLGPIIAQKVMRQFSASTAEQAPPVDDLTPRELEVLKLIAAGLGNQEIAQELTISEKTVKNHINNIFSKLHISDRTQAMLYAIRRGLVEV